MIELDPATLDVEATLRAIVAGLPTIVYAYDVQQGRSLFQNRNLAEFLGHDGPWEMDEWRRLIHPDDARRFPAYRERLAQLAEGETTVFEYRMRHADGGWRWLLSRDRPFQRDPDGRLRVVLGSTADITEQKRTEEALREHETLQALLIGELNHRVSNTLATVQALAYQSRLATSSPIDFHARFGAQLRSLDEAHRLLAREKWDGAPLEEIVRLALAPFAVPGDHRLLLDGPPLRVDAHKVVSVTMLMHELATNAVRHGALRDNDGRLEVTWRIADDAACVHLAWIEHAALAGDAPARTGFGSHLVERVLVRELGGTVSVQRPATGLELRATLPLSSWLVRG